MTENDTYCRNCSENLNDPKNAGFPFDGDWYCSGFCAEVCAGFWSRGHDVSDYNSQLSETVRESDDDRDDDRELRTDGGHSSSGTEQKETVTVTFLTNHEIDPDEFDLRVRDPDKIRRQLMNAANRTGSIQQVAGNSEENLQRLRKRVKKAKQSGRSTDTATERSGGRDE